MESLVDSEAVFREHVGTVGLPDDAIERLINRGIDTMAPIAYSVGQPGGAPSQADLERLIDGGEWNCKRPAESPSASGPSKKHGKVIKRKGETKGKHKQPQNMPEALQDKRDVTGKGKRICWDYNLPHGHSHTDVNDGGECPKGVHLCMEWNCRRNHPLHKHE